MKNVSVIVFFLLATMSTYAAPPKAVKTIPENGNQNVDPGLRQIRIEFDQDMSSGGFSICGGGPKFPETVGKARWLNKRTLVMGVKLKPNYEYQMSINCPSYQNCKNINGEPAEIYPISFKTTSALNRDPNQPAQSPAILLQQGIYAEETEGNLEKAMEIYSQIRSDYNDVERVSAIATYQLGMCNLKKDKKQEAIKLFQEVVDYFPEQTVAAKKAQQQLDKLGVKNDADKNIFDMLGQASSFVGNKYGESCAEAGMKKLYSNSHIYVVDKNFVMRWGGIGYAMNFSDKPITGKYRLSGTTYPNQKLYGVMNEPIDVEILPDPNRSGFYNIYWIPKEPFQPGGFLSYGWAVDGSKALAKTEQGYQLKMNNHFGDHCFETFFLAVPEGMQIVSKSDEYTGKNTISGWDIYWWKKEICKNTDHTVNVTLIKIKEVSKEDKLQAENLASQGWSLWKERKLAEAEETFKKAVELDPQCENAYQGLGWAQFNQGKKNNAKDSFEKCIAINSKNGAALNGLGWLADGQGDANEAIKWWEKAVEVSEGHATASLEGLTKVYMEKGDYQNAVKYYEMWLKVEPKNENVKQSLNGAKNKIK